MITLAKEEPESYIIERDISVLRAVQPTSYIAELKKLTKPGMNEYVRNDLFELIKELKDYDEEVSV